MGLSGPLTARRDRNKQDHLVRPGNFVDFLPLRASAEEKTKFIAVALAATPQQREINRENDIRHQ